MEEMTFKHDSELNAAGFLMQMVGVIKLFIILIYLSVHLRKIIYFLNRGYNNFFKKVYLIIYK